MKAGDKVRVVSAPGWFGENALRQKIAYLPPIGYEGIAIEDEYDEYTIDSWWLGLQNNGKEMYFFECRLEKVEGPINNNKDSKDGTE